MSDVKFGRKQLKNPTPTKIGSAITLFTVIASILATWVGTATFIPAQPSTVIQGVLTLLIAISNGIKPFFGTDTLSSGMVDVDNVSEMESKPEEENKN